MLKLIFIVVLVVVLVVVSVTSKIVNEGNDKE